jgi:hypothetical protein
MARAQRAQTPTRDTSAFDSGVPRWPRPAPAPPRPYPVPTFSHAHEQRFRNAPRGCWCVRRLHASRAAVPRSWSPGWRCPTCRTPRCGYPLHTTKARNRSAHRVPSAKLQIEPTQAVALTILRTVALYRICGHRIDNTIFRDTPRGSPICDTRLDLFRLGLASAEPSVLGTSFMSDHPPHHRQLHVKLLKSSAVIMPTHPQGTTDPASAPLAAGSRTQAQQMVRQHEVSRITVRPAPSGSLSRPS